MVLNITTHMPKSTIKGADSLAAHIRYPRIPNKDRLINASSHKNLSSSRNTIQGPFSFISHCEILIVVTVSACRGQRMLVFRFVDLASIIRYCKQGAVEWVK
ncbi:hypothetical protein XPA_010193 [Xanthoria parietina]